MFLNVRGALFGSRDILVTSSLSDLAVRREKHRSYGEIWSRSRTMVVPFDESEARFRTRPVFRSRTG